MIPHDAMPGTTNTGDDWDDAQKSEIVARVVAGTLSIRHACDRYGLSPERIRDWVMVFRRSALQAFDDHLRETLVRQGLDANDLAGAAFNGTLDDIAISDLVQTMTMGRKDGLVTVSHDGRQSRIWFAAGAIVDAESGRLRGERAAQRILAFEHGRVVAEFCPVRRPQRIQMPTPALLLDGARRKDECALLQRQLGDGLYRAAPEAAGERAVSSAEAALLRAFAVPRVVADVVAESELGDLETLGVISALVKEGSLLPGGPRRASLIQPARESALIQASVLSVLPPPSARRVGRAPLSGRFRIGLAAALCAVGIGGGFLVTRLSSPRRVETPAPSLPSGDRPRAAHSPPVIAEPAPAGDPNKVHRDEALVLPTPLAVPHAGGRPSRLRESSPVPALETAPARANESAPPRIPSSASPPFGSAAVVERQPRMRIIDEEKTPSMRILE